MALGLVGQGTTLSLSVDSVIGRVRSLQMPEWLTEPVDFSSLDESDWMIFLPAGLADPGSFVAEIYLDPTIALPTLRTIQTATITFPIASSGNTTNAALTGSGFITGIGWPNAAIAEAQMQQITFKFDGNSVVPAYTLEAA